MKRIFICALVMGMWSAASCVPANAGDASAPNIGVPGISDNEEIPDWIVRWELARCLVILERYDEAIADYKILLKEKPDLQKARIELGQALLWNGRETEVEAVIEQIEPVRLDVNDRILLADVYMALKQYDIAKPLYRDVLNKNPDDHKTRLKLAELLSWQRKYDEALAEYRTILKTLPEDIQIRRKYAMVLIWAGNHEEAVTELRRTLP